MFQTSLFYNLIFYFVDNLPGKGSFPGFHPEVKQEILYIHGVVFKSCYDHLTLMQLHAK